MFPDNNHKKIEVSGLPCLPEALIRLLEACNREDGDFSAAADAAALDPGLTARLFDAAFTAPDLHPQKFPTLAEVLIRLGQVVIRTIAVHAAVGHLFPVQTELKDGEVAAFDAHHFWRKAIRGAHLARLLAEHTGYGNPQEAYFAASLRDMGQLILLARHPQEYDGILKEVKAVSELMLAEKNRFGVTHLEVAEQLARRWRITSFLPDAITYQHHSLESVQGAHPLVKIINLSAHLANRSGKLSDPQFDHAKSLFGLTHDDLARLVRDADDAMDQAAQKLRLPVAGKRREQATNPISPHAELARHVRTFALLSAAHKANGSSSRGEAALIALAEQLRVAFGFPAPLAFILDSAQNSLRGRTLPGQSELIGQLEIPLLNGRSLAGECWQTMQVLHSFHANVHGRRSVIDEQIGRLAGGTGILCLPLIHRGAVSGVVVIGIEEADLPHIETEHQALLAFAAQAAQSIASGATNIPIGEDAADIIPMSQMRLRKAIHEVNNPLGIMKNYIKILRLKMNKEDPAQFGLSVLDEEIDHVANIVGSLNRSTEPAGAEEPVNINALIFDLTRITNEPLLIRDNIRLKTELDHAVKPLRCDKGKLKQVLVNLVKNAAEAMEGGGEITISTRDEIEFDGSRYVEIAVKDNGPGLPQSVLDHLFEPVVSSKGAEHFGLGLSIVHGLVQDLSGIIRCQSDKKNGARFQILLPGTLLQA